MKPFPYVPVQTQPIPEKYRCVGCGVKWSQDIRTGLCRSCARPGVAREE